MSDLARSAIAGLLVCILAGQVISCDSMQRIERDIWEMQNDIAKIEGADKAMTNRLTASHVLLACIAAFFALCWIMAEVRPYLPEGW